MIVLVIFSAAGEQRFEFVTKYTQKFKMDDAEGFIGAGHVPSR